MYCPRDLRYHTVIRKVLREKLSTITRPSFCQNFDQSKSTNCRPFQLVLPIVMENGVKFSDLQNSAKWRCNKNLFINYSKPDTD